MSIWAPVVAALGASLLTGLFGFGVVWWQQRKRDQRDAAASKKDAYHRMIAESLSFTIRAQALRNTMRGRSGMNERLDLALRLRRPLDPMELHDWLAQGYEPLNDAWSKVEITGSTAAVEIANELMNACAAYVQEATELGKARGRIATYLRGIDWTPDQDAALEASAGRAITARKAFIKLARAELGMNPVPTQRE